ncbi:hypothetical protein P43SY_010470 [Pythium insidiosum]|uniref:Reverse transcriptase n=1 Tax=Pythium insidiosum TaxID=114742 RepID=A0AAD5LSV7_PYTIN|nr:hypothetical protein P43SY_010470 [Pythium insidiosum]
MGRETLRDIGIDVENFIDQLAGPDRVATADHDDSEDDNVGVAEKPVANVATLLERMLDDAAVYSVEIDIDVAEGLSESLFVDAPIQVEYTTVQWEPEIEWIEATEFKENLRKGDYSEVFHLNVLKDDGSVIDNVAVRRLVDKFGDMLCEEPPDRLPPERDIEHTLQMKPDARPSTRSPFRHAHVEREALIPIDELLDRLAGAVLFTLIDLASGYYQVEAVLLRILHDFHDAAVVSHPGIQLKG